MSFKKARKINSYSIVCEYYVEQPFIKIRAYYKKYVLMSHLGASDLFHYFLFPAYLFYFQRYFISCDEQNSINWKSPSCHMRSIFMIVISLKCKL